MDKLILFTIGLSRVKNLGIKSILYLLERHGSIEELYHEYNKGNLSLVKFDFDDLKRVEDELLNSNVSAIPFWHSKYPALLNQLPDRPVLIYAKGNLDILSKDSISIVGTRKMTQYGKTIINSLIPALADRLVTVSGMAYGTDAYVHLKTIELGGLTIAVLPSSVLNPIPEFNTYLYNKILDSKGLVVSEFLPGSPVSKGMFPRRNRIIAGLSSKTIVIEAGEKSGAIITAKLAFDYNREVYAIPGNLNSDNSKGCNLLIKQNIATLVADISEFMSQNFESFKNKSYVLSDLGDFDKIIYYAILQGFRTVNDISNHLQLPASSISVSCSALLISGAIEEDPSSGKFYIK